MLTLTRRVGESIYLGDDTCLTVYDRLRYHVLIGVLAPVGMSLHLGELLMRPAELPGGEHFYLLTLLSQESFRVGPCRVGVRFKPTFLSSPSPSKRQLKVDVDAPPGLGIDREEIRMQRSQALGQPQPTVPVWEWLRRANASVSCGRVA